jgi:hypothetical protein
MEEVMLQAWRRWRRMMIWVSYRVPAWLELRILEVLYGDGVGFRWEDVWRMKGKGMPE